MDMQARPMSVTIFGILNIGFGMLGLVSLLVAKLVFSQPNMAVNQTVPEFQTNAQVHTHTEGNTTVFDFHTAATTMSDPRYIAWQGIETPLSGVANVVLLAAGIGLLLLQSWARIVSIIDGIYLILAGIVGCIIILSGGMSLIIKAASVMVSVIGLAYPILLIIFMTRPKVIAALKPAPPVA